MPRSILRLLLVLSACFWLGAIRPATAQEIPFTCTFDSSSERWSNQSPLDDNNISEWTAESGRTGGGIHMKGQGGDENLTRIWRKVIRTVPKGKTVSFSVWAKGKGVRNVVAMCVQAHGADPSNFSAFATTQLETPLKGDFEWTRIAAQVGVPTDTTSLQVLLMLVGDGEVWFDDFAAELGGDATLIAPGLFEVRGQFTLTAPGKDDAVLLMPIPLSYLQQVPLSYEFTCDPPDRVKNIRLFEDATLPGNWLAELTIRGVAPSGAAAPAPATGSPGPLQVSWTSYVLIGPGSFADLPKSAPIPEHWPADAQPWLRSTSCVQASDERIMKIAADVRKNDTDAIAIMKNTLKRVHTIYERQGERTMSLDAVNALDHVGSCTSCANLVAALLRAGGIPARILAGYPAWSGPLQTHYIVEAYIPTYGWYPIESTMLREGWDRHQQVQVSIVPTSYEDRSGFRPGVAPGVPFLSLTEKAEGSAPFFTLGTLSKALPGCDHEAKAFRNLPVAVPATDWESLLTASRAKWSGWLSTHPASGERGELRFGPTREQLSTISLSSLLELMRK